MVKFAFLGAGERARAGAGAGSGAGVGAGARTGKVLEQLAPHLLWPWSSSTHVGLSKYIIVYNCLEPDSAHHSSFLGVMASTKVGNYSIPAISQATHN